MQTGQFKVKQAASMLAIYISQIHFLGNCQAIQLKYLNSHLGLLGSVWKQQETSVTLK